VSGLDLRQVEDVVNQREQIVARRFDSPRELDLVVRQIAIGIVAQQLRQDQQ